MTSALTFLIAVHLVTLMVVVHFVTRHAYDHPRSCTPSRPARPGSMPSDTADEAHE